MKIFCHFVIIFDNIWSFCDKIWSFCDKKWSKIVIFIIFLNFLNIIKSLYYNYLYAFLNFGFLKNSQFFFLKNA